MYRLILTLTVGCVFGACTSNTNINQEPGRTALVRPGVGSVFVYHVTAWDTLGRISDDWIDTEVVFQSGVSYQGKDNVVAISYKNDPALKYAVYYNYESNGDIDDYYDIAPPYGWRTYPIASHGSARFSGLQLHVP